jgi:hypothetical protein
MEVTNLCGGILGILVRKGEGILIVLSAVGDMMMRIRIDIWEGFILGECDVVCMSFLDDLCRCMGALCIGC